LRIDGHLYPAGFLDAAQAEDLLHPLRIKLNLPSGPIAEPQYRRCTLMVYPEEQPYHLRLGIIPTACGESWAIRVLPRFLVYHDLPSLGMPEAEQAQMQDLLAQPNGLVLLCGPAGCGKTTTLRTLTHLLSQPHTKLISIEDPVEYTYPMAHQVDVDTLLGLNFSVALKSILRQSPDAVVLGEIRDAATAKIAFQVGLSGHKALSTLHGLSLRSHLRRLRHLKISPQATVASLAGMVHQRLVRRLCAECKKPYHLPQQSQWERLWHTLKLEGTPQATRFYAPSGCARCLYTGYYGRMGLFSILAPVPAYWAGTPSYSDEGWEGHLRAQRMGLMLHQGYCRAAQGLTSLKEAICAAESPSCNDWPSLQAYPGLYDLVDASLQHEQQHSYTADSLRGEQLLALIAG
jgi:type II secretory ATPase GspE/PulE/Tfp pilus assembly ATPase PilB-like protein